MTYLQSFPLHFIIWMALCFRAMLTAISSQNVLRCHSLHIFPWIKCCMNHTSQQCQYPLTAELYLMYLIKYLCKLLHQNSMGLQRLVKETLCTTFQQESPEPLTSSPSFNTLFIIFFLWGGGVGGWGQRSGQRPIASFFFFTNNYNMSILIVLNKEHDFTVYLYKVVPTFFFFLVRGGGGGGGGGVPIWVYFCYVFTVSMFLFYIFQVLSFYFICRLML